MDTVTRQLRLLLWLRKAVSVYPQNMSIERQAEEVHVKNTNLYN